MTEPIIPRDQVAENLRVSPKILVRYEARGLVHATRDGRVEGYAPAEVRRIWSIVSYQRDLGINLAGVEAILKLREHLADVHHHVDTLAHELRALLEAQSEHDG
jgi:MerR family transcriptional regulator, heat shock protein HspR